MKTLWVVIALLLLQSKSLWAAPLNFELMMRFKPTPEYIVLQKPQIRIVENRSGLSGQCALMQGNYLHLWQKYRAESVQLMSLLEQGRSASPESKGILLPQIQELHMQLQNTISELNQLVRPDWSRESLEVQVSWSIANDALFDIPQMNDDLRDSFVSPAMADFLNSRGLSVRPGFSPGALRHFKDYAQKTYLAGLSYQVTEAQYMGQESADLLPFFGRQIYPLPQTEDPEIVFSYNKPMTWLEYCQFTQTAEFSLEAQFVLKNFGGGVAQKNQKFILRSIENEK